jgi:hypothetical protein
LFVAGKDIHGGPNPTCCGKGSPNGNSGPYVLYSVRSDTEGPNPEVDDTGSPLFAQRRAH